MSALDIIVVIAWFTLIGLGLYAYGSITAWREERRDDDEGETT